MFCNEAGLQIIKIFEGFRSQPYRCSADVPSIGYGSTFCMDGRRVRMDMEPVTKDEAEDLLRWGVKNSERAVDKLIRVGLNSNEFSSLVSFVYNLGSGRLQSSTLRVKLNRGDRLGAADELPKWRRAGGRILRGLVLRRQAERELFLCDYTGV
jgi:lysozyme